MAGNTISETVINLSGIFIYIIYRSIAYIINVNNYIIECIIKKNNYLYSVEPAKPLNNAQIGRSFYLVPYEQTLYKNIYFPAGSYCSFKKQGIAN